MIRGTYGLVSSALAVASVVVTSGCAQDYSGLLILQNQAPGAPPTCELTASQTAAFISHGTALVSDLGGGYVLTPLIQSGLTNREGTTNGDIVELHTATVVIEPVDSADSQTVVDALKELQGRTRYISGSVTPKGGLAAIHFDAIDSAQAMAMATAMMDNQRVEVLVRASVHGDTQGTEVSSQDFLYPITLIKSTGLVSLGPCSSLPVGYMGQSSASCFGTGQDGGFTECCTDATGNAVCPAVGPTM